MQIDNVKIFARQFFFSYTKATWTQKSSTQHAEKNPAGKPKNSLASLAILFLTWPNQFN